MWGTQRPFYSPTLFNRQSTIVNRQSPYHHDQGVVVVRVAGQMLVEGPDDGGDHFVRAAEGGGVQQHGFEAFLAEGLAAGVAGIDQAVGIEDQAEVGRQIDGGGLVAVVGVGAQDQAGVFERLQAGGRRK